MTRQWSKYQLAIFEAVSNTNRNLAINAVAGSGKTSSLVEIYNRLPRNTNALFLAFNKHIVNELSSRLQGCDCLTIHSLGFKAIKSVKSKIQVKEHKIADLVDEYFSRNEPTWLPSKFYGAFFGIVRNAVDKARLTMTDLCVESVADDMLAHFGLWGELAAISDEADNTSLNLLGEQLVKCTCRVLENSDKTYERSGIIDFTDMLYLPVKYGYAIVGYDVVLVDEAQDLNAAQLELVMKAAGRFGRVIAVGDSRQAIMGFCGADSNSFSNIVKRTNAVELPLSICYRCPSSHIELAKKIVPQIEASPSAICGTVETINMKQFSAMPRRNDLIICRVNAPLVGAALKLIANGIQARIRGRNIAAGLTKMIRESAKHVFFSEGFAIAMTAALERYADHRLAILQSKPHTEVQQETVTDQLECVQVFMTGRPDITSSEQLCSELENLFADEGAAVWLSSIHRAKGLEADRVFVLRADKMRIERKGMLPWQVEQEANLEYVGLTRGKEALYLVKDDKKDSEDAKPVIEVKAEPVQSVLAPVVVEDEPMF